jgi:hypothetical protein
MSMHDETRFPNAFVRFKRNVGMLGVCVWSAFASIFAIGCAAETARGGWSGKLVAAAIGVAVAIALRPLMFLKPSRTLNALMLTFVGVLFWGTTLHRPLGKPDWSVWLMWGTCVFLLAAFFVFWSSKFMYIAKMLEELPPQPQPANDARDAEATIDQEVEEARRREAER